MKSVRFALAGTLILLLSHFQMSSAQQGQGGWGGGNGASAGSWSSANSNSGQPGSNGNSQFSYGYGGVDANGVPYGGYGGNGGYHVNITNEYGRLHSYNGGQGDFGTPPRQPIQPGYNGPYSYTSTNTNRNARPNSSSSVYAAAWSTFYVICLFSLFLIFKS